jgi:hypothetical protein
MGTLLAQQRISEVGPNVALRRGEKSKAIPLACRGGL